LVSTENSSLQNQLSETIEKTKTELQKTDTLRIISKVVAVLVLIIAIKLLFFRKKKRKPLRKRKR